jgi:hypothetical protein
MHRVSGEKLTVGCGAPLWSGRVLLCVPARVLVFEKGVEWEGVSGFRGEGVSGFRGEGVEWEGVLGEGVEWEGVQGGGGFGGGGFGGGG